jgi:hypothetical protein
MIFINIFNIESVNIVVQDGSNFIKYSPYDPRYRKIEDPKFWGKTITSILKDSAYSGARKFTIYSDSANPGFYKIVFE